jgi:hypothetical protein
MISTFVFHFSNMSRDYEKTTITAMYHGRWDSHETWKCADPELEKQIRCFLYVSRSDVERLQQLYKCRYTTEESRTNFLGLQHYFALDPMISTFVFHFSNMSRDYEKTTITAMYHGRWFAYTECVGKKRFNGRVLPTGFGKSTCYVPPFRFWTRYYIFFSLWLSVIH